MSSKAIHPLYKQLKAICKRCASPRSKNKVKGPLCDNCFRDYQAEKQREYRRRNNSNGKAKR